MSQHSLEESKIPENDLDNHSLQDDTQSHQPHILVVEDEPVMRNTLVRLLKRAGFKTSEAGEGLDAIEKIDEEPIDMIITDILMPEYDGIEFIRNVRDINPDIPIIAISGGGNLGETSFLDAVHEMGATFTLRKPFSRYDLLSIIHENLRPHHRSHMTDEHQEDVVSPEGFEPSTY